VPNMSEASEEEESRTREWPNEGPRAHSPRAEIVVVAAVGSALQATKVLGVVTLALAVLTVVSLGAWIMCGPYRTLRGALPGRPK
jgi:hypothetical protein